MEKLKTAAASTWRIIKRWAKAEVAFVLPLASEYGFDAITRLQEQGTGDTLITVAAYALLVWLVPNGE